MKNMETPETLSPPSPALVGEKQIAVVFLTDQKYTNLTAIAIDSLASSFERCTTGYALAIHVVCIEVDEAGKHVMAQAAAPYAAHGVTLCCVDHVLEGNPQGKTRWLKLVSLKLHLADILPELDRAIFLDSDLVVLGDLSPLWQTDLENHWMAVVPCVLDHPRCLSNYNIFKIRFNQTVKPINAGVILFDLAKMRAQGVSRRLDRWQQENFAQLKLPEQEAIAVNYPGEWKPLSHIWNFRPYGEPYWAASSWPEFREYLSIQPVIVHFQGNVRPFDLAMDQPYFKDWMRSHQRINPGKPLKRKRLGYFQFVFFEYPDMLCRISNLLPGGMLRFGLMIPLLGLLIWPHALSPYLNYLRAPENYRWRIERHMANPG